MADIDLLEKPYPRPLSGAKVDQLPPALVPSRAPLQGKYVELVAQEAALHADDLYEAGHGSDEALRIWDYLPEGPWANRTDYHTKIRQQSAALDRVYYAIRPLRSAHFCGQSSFMDIDAAAGVIEIGYIWFGLELQRTPAATEALYLMIRHAMDDLGYRRMQWRCNSLNEKSRRAARRLGFRFEGVFYNHMIFKNKNRDTAWYSILDDEWPEVRQILEAWLDELNFDHDGTAKTSLYECMMNRKPSARRVESE